MKLKPYNYAMIKRYLYHSKRTSFFMYYFLFFITSFVAIDLYCHLTGYLGSVPWAFWMFLAVIMFILFFKMLFDIKELKKSDLLDDYKQWRSQRPYGFLSQIKIWGGSALILLIIEGCIYFLRSDSIYAEYLDAQSHLQSGVSMILIFTMVQLLFDYILWRLSIKKEPTIEEMVGAS